MGLVSGRAPGPGQDMAQPVPVVLIAGAGEQLQLWAGAAVAWGGRFGYMRLRDAAPGGTWRIYKCSSWEPGEGVGRAGVGGGLAVPGGH